MPPTVGPSTQGQAPAEVYTSGAWGEARVHRSPGSLAQREEGTGSPHFRVRGRRGEGVAGWYSWVDGRRGLGSGLGRAERVQAGLLSLREGTGGLGSQVCENYGLGPRRTEADKGYQGPGS